MSYQLGEIAQVVAEKDLEIERLREQLRECRENVVGYLEAEIEQLRAVLRNVAGDAEFCRLRLQSDKTELLKALYGVIEWWDKDGPHRAEPEFVTEARAAIAKAEGK